MKAIRKEHKGLPGIVISALGGGSGKTLVSIGIISALKNTGKRVVPFKKGPDYIDAGWLSLAAGIGCRNLDTFMAAPQKVAASFCFKALDYDIAVVEGNRGLYDSIDTNGTASTAELARLLNLPVILCLDCTKTTRTMAAIVKGCIDFDPKLNIKGVILNKIAGPRHRNILKESIEKHCKIPVIGAIPKLKKESFPERHLGLVPAVEHSWAVKSVDIARDAIEKNVDIESLISIANTAAPFDFLEEEGLRYKIELNPAPKIGILRDRVFQFYYTENIEAIKAAGGEPVFISPLNEKSFPDNIDALYMGGGFPETYAAKLSENKLFRNKIKEMADSGLPIYAECGGLMYLGEKLILEGKVFQMTGVFPVVFGLSAKPQAHGYTIVKADRLNPYFSEGEVIKGHEFHYSKVLETGNINTALSVERGTGFMNKRDGLCFKNVFASYTHIYSIGAPSWAKNFVKKAADYKNRG